MANTEKLSRVARTATGILWRSLVVGAGFYLFSILGNAAAQALRLPVFSIGDPVSPGTYLGTVFVSGVLFGLTLGPVASRLPLRIFDRIGVLFVTLFFLNQLTNVIEAVFFTTIPAVEWTFSLFASAVEHAGLAVLLALLFPPRSAERGWAEVLRETLSRRRWWDWLLRLVLAGLAYFPVYFLFGMIVSPIVVPYYSNPALGLQLTIPGFDLIVPLELFRGMLYALMLFPLIAFLSAGDVRSRWSVAFWIILMQATLGSWQPMLNASFWPAALRLAHGLEITADCIVYGLIAVRLLAPDSSVSGTVRKDDPVVS